MRTRRMRTRHRLLIVPGILAASVACRTERVEQQPCDPANVAGTWVERREPAASAADTAPASLSLSLTPPPDSVDRLPPQTMISLVISGPAEAARPDTVRLLAAEIPGGPLWSGGDLRAGTYSATLTTEGFAAGPRDFAIAPGERLQINVTMGRTCESSSQANGEPGGKARE